MREPEALGYLRDDRQLLAQRQIPILFHEPPQIHARAPLGGDEDPLFHLAQVANLGDMAVREFRAGCQMHAALFLRLVAEARNNLQNLHCKFAIAKCVTNPECLSCRAAAQRFNDLILADRLHLNSSFRLAMHWLEAGTRGLPISSSAALTNKDRMAGRASTGHLREVSSF